MVLRYNIRYNKTSIWLLFIALLWTSEKYKVNKYRGLGANGTVGEKVGDNLYIYASLYSFFQMYTFLQQSKTLPFKKKFGFQ